MSLSMEDIRWVAHLARLELTEAEYDRLGRDLRAIVDYVDLLQEIDTDKVEPLAHPHDVQNVFRADEPQPSLPVDEALANSPDRRDDFFGVPAVLD
jgi:aspartyl-tRNA(Asn)/glutamyl-tRNA(Gln) amidotransferase subunit C